MSQQQKGTTMTEKYIELKPQIVSDYALVGATAVQGGVGIALEWLDRHPDQVPGRTITERVKITDTEAYELYESARSFSLDDFKLALESIDAIETVDDPEPTNAEKLADAITNAAHGVGIGSTTANIKAIAKRLDEAGVKAGGDDDH